SRYRSPTSTIAARSTWTRCVPRGRSRRPPPAVIAPRPGTGVTGDPATGVTEVIGATASVVRAGTGVIGGTARSGAAPPAVRAPRGTGARPAVMALPVGTALLAVTALSAATATGVRGTAVVGATTPTTVVRAASTAVGATGTPDGGR